VFPQVPHVCHPEIGNVSNTAIGVGGGEPLPSVLLGDACISEVPLEAAPHPARMQHMNASTTKRLCFMAHSNQVSTTGTKDRSRAIQFSVLRTL
jgi:hypothetical protein